LTRQFEDLFIKEDIIKEGEKLPDKVKITLEKSKEIIDDNLSSLINSCIGIENDIEFINNIDERIKKYNNLKNIHIEFFPKDIFIDQIKNLGEIIYINSSIINDINDLNLIVNWIVKAINKNLIKIEPIFKMSVNGTKSEDFHKLFR